MSWPLRLPELPRKAGLGERGFSVDQSVRLEASDGERVQRLTQYFLRCPFS